MKNSYKKYDIVILTHKPKHYLIDSLNRLNLQELLPEKIIIYNTDEKNFYINIDKNEYQDTINNLKVKPEVYHIPYEEFDHGKTRNEASNKSFSPYIMFMTDDAVPYDNYLTKNLLLAFDNYDVAGAYAKQLPRENSKLKEKYVRAFNYGDNDIVKDISTENIYGIKNYFCSNVCSMYNRKIFDSLGKFDENIILNEDTFFAYKSIKHGYKVVYKADAKVIHSHDYTYKEQYKRNFDIGVSHVDKADIFQNIPAENEGKKMVKYVLKNLIMKVKIFGAIDFFIECIYRYLGFKAGKNYKTLSKNKCLNNTNNKQYFSKKFKNF